MPQPEGWSVGVTVVNPQLSKSYPEYKVETTGNKTKCYIESVEGQPFKISISLNQTTPPSDVTSCFTAHCYVDGQQSDSLLFGKCGEHVLLEAQMSGRRVAVGKVAPFEFGATRFTEDGDLRKDTLSNLGSIVIKVGRVEPRPSKDPKCPVAAVPKERQINEKAKKALLTHSVKYGAIKDVQNPTFWYDIKYIDPIDSPMYVFEVLYRSKAILEALEVVPADPDAHEDEDDVSSSASDDEELSPEQIKQLKAYNHSNELRQLKKSIKREPDVPPEFFDLTAPQVKKRRVVVDLTL